MISPCLRHNRKVKSQAIAKATPKLAPTSDSLHILLIALKNDVDMLRNLPTTAERIEFKKQTLLPRWLPHAELYINAGKAFKNPIFAYCVIWLFDVGDINKALKWADIAIEQNQDTPPNIKRTFSAFTADFVLEWAHQAASNGHSIEPYFGDTFKKVVNQWRLHEEIRCKWFKFAGLILLRDENGQPRASAIDCTETLLKADSYLEQAEKLYKHAQVKTIRASIAQRINALTK